MDGDGVRPIGDYGLIGDTRTAALCARDGSIDWMCAPRFDSRPVFGRLIGGPAGGSFSIRPAGIRSTTRRYVGDTAVLETTWRCDTGAARLTEGMILDVGGRLLPQSLLVRRIECLQGHVDVSVRFDPVRDLTRPPDRQERRTGALISSWSDGCAVSLQARLPFEGGGARVRLEPETPLITVMGVHDRSPAILVDPVEAWEMLLGTERWWDRWARPITYRGPEAHRVIRSLITLRLLTYAPSGAPVAAPTTSLPEEIGGERNWDYRYAWPRDAAIGAHAFLAAGRAEEAAAFLGWLEMATRLGRPRVRSIYTLHGTTKLDERERRDVPGYADSRPVREGNAAGGQHQLDAYGWVVEAAWQLHRTQSENLPSHTWHRLSALTDRVAGTWPEPDAGMWEARSPERHHVHSKVMAWLVLDRMSRMAGAHRTSGRRRARWERERDRAARDIRDRGFDRDRGSYVRAYGSSELDAALLLLPMTGFEDQGSARLRGTVDAISRGLSAGGDLLYRYTPGRDGVPGAEGAFLACSFWLVRALCATGRPEEAGALFERMCERANDVGLYAEEMDPATGRHLGNFPQALTHSALVEAGLALERATGGR